MFGRGDQSARHGVAVQILDLLQHHLVAGDGHGMKALLPDLTFAVRFVGGVEVRELMEQPVAVFGLQLIENPPGGVPLEIAHDAHEIGRGEDGVEVGIEDDPGVDAEFLVLAAIAPCVDEEVAARRGGEDGQPRDDGGGDEVRSVGFADAVATAHDGDGEGSSASGTSAFRSVTSERGSEAKGRPFVEAARELGLLKG